MKLQISTNPGFAPDRTGRQNSSSKISCSVAWGEGGEGGGGEVVGGGQRVSALAPDSLPACLFDFVHRLNGA